MLNLQAVRSIILDPNAGYFYDLSTVVFSKNKTRIPEVNYIGKTNYEYFSRKIIPIQLCTLESQILIEVE